MPPVPYHLFSAAMVLLALGASPAVAPTVGFQQRTVVDSALGPIEIGVWYPASGTPSASPLGLFSQVVATNAAIAGARHSLIVISHGAGGSIASHYDTALDLARSGFIVVALTHPGDNTRDQSAVGNQRDLVDRPRQVTRVLDYMLAEWEGRSHVDTARIGMVGVSLGGFTALTLTGGTPDLGRIHDHCVRLPDAPECRFITERHGDQLRPPFVPGSAWHHDARIRAVVIAAPALGFVFSGGGLGTEQVPVSVWRAEYDADAPNPENSDIVIRELPNRPEVHTVAAAGHFVFLAPCSDALVAVAPLICHDAASVSRISVHRAFNSAAAQFFNQSLR